MDSLGNPTGICFQDMIFDYTNNSSNLILSLIVGDGTSTFHVTYQISNNELNFQYLFNFDIDNGDTTHCVDCYAIASAVNEIPEYDCP